MSAHKESADVCVLCCREIKIFASGKCDHPVCHECSTRMRVLCDQKECPICRRIMPTVLFTNCEQLYTTLARSQPLMNKKYMIVFEDEEIQEAFELLLENKCKSCGTIFKTFRQLKDHMRRDHELHYCELCVEDLKIFPFEKKCYSRTDLVRHRRIGDPDETSHRGHPLCEYCDQRYLDNDDLFRHLRREHYFCHFCDADGKHQYYRDYHYLKTHFRREHYLCEEDECANEKFIGAFRTSIDLQAHKALHHTRNKSKAEVKQARTLDVEFTIVPRNSSNGGSPQSDSRYSRYGRQNQQRNRNVDDNMNRENFISFDHEPNYQNHLQRESIRQEIDMGSVQEFPHLPGGLDMNTSYASAKASVMPDNSASSFIHSYGRQAGFGRMNNAIRTEEFPALGSTSVLNQNQIPPRVSQEVLQNPQKSFNTNTNNIQPSSWSKQKPQISASQESLGNAQDMIRNAIYSHKAGLKKKSSMPPFKVEGPEPEDANAKKKLPTWISKKNVSSFEENFPKLTTKNKNSYLNLQLIPPENTPVIEAPVEKNDSYGFQVVTKAKSKKKKAKQTSAISEGHMKSSFQSIIKKDVSPPSTSSDESIVHKMKVENEENEDPSKYVVQIKDCVSYSTGKEKQVEGDEFQVPQPINLFSEDFPPLPTPDNTVRVPPGFNANQKVPPPGFSTKSSFGNSSLSNMSLSSVAQQLTLSKKDKCLKSAVENVVDGDAYSGKLLYYYRAPAEFQKRNNELPKQILYSVNGQEHLFDEFKSISRQFRQNSVSATDYYSKCLDILGKEGFLSIIAELIALLPDISKQQQLLTVHSSFVEKESKMRGAVPKRNGPSTDTSQTEIIVCTVCQQVLVKKDYKSHQNAHEVDFCNSSS